MSAKYNITIGNDRYSDTTFVSDVAGIGKESDGSHFQAQSAGLVVTSNGALNATASI